MVQDPAGLLERIPELEPLCQDPRVRRAVESGNPFKVYRALVWTRLLGGLHSHRETIKALLGNRRLFAMPNKGSLFLGTFNSVGASFVGHSEPDPNDGTHISLHAVVILFAIPLLPLGAYVVRRGENKALSTSWQVFARVPLGFGAWLYNRAVAVAALALIAFGALSAYHSSRNGDVRIVNGFEQPLEVTIGSQHVTVPARGHMRVTLPLGKQEGRAVSKSGIEVDRVELNVRSPMDFLGWNVAGGAPLYRSVSIYTKSKPKPGAPDRTPGPTIYCGQKVVELRDVDYVLASPPEQLQMSSSSSSVTRSYVEVARDPPDQIETCYQYLVSQSRIKHALPFVETAAKLEGWGDHWGVAALGTAAMVGLEEGLRIAAAAREARPDFMKFHRAYQALMEQAGRREQLVAEYEQRAQAEPASASAQYLAARLARGRQSQARLEALAARFPEDPNVLWGVSVVRFRAGDWAASLEAIARLEAADPAMAGELMTERATALVALGRTAEARKLAVRAFETKDGPQEEAAEVYARVAAVEARSDGAMLVEKLERGRGGEEGKRWWLRARAGLPLDGAPEDDALIRFVQAARKDPAEAVKRAPALSDVALFNVPANLWALVLGEAIRSGSQDVERSLLRARALSPLDIEGLRKFVAGEPVELEDTDLDLPTRAAACYVRSRNPRLDAKERRKLVERAAALDPLRSDVTGAVANWTP